MSQEEMMELQRQNCIFCKIAEKKIPSKIIHEDDKVICILDINPASEGHILVYPKKHYRISPQIPESLLAHIFKIVTLMSKTLLKTFQTGGTSVFIANGVAAGQKSPHILIHVIPRRANDGIFNLQTYEITDEQKEKIKSILKKELIKVFGKETSQTSNTKEKSEEKTTKKQNKQQKIDLDKITEYFK